MPAISQVFGHWLNQVTKILARILRFFYIAKIQIQSQTPLRGFGEKSSISLGLKTVVLAETSNQNSGRLVLEFFSQQNPLVRSQLV
jgi:hypothetical protein